ncbi:hypothetical protein GCM10023341_24680 [Ornithinimicrobium tianjinense]
MHAGYAVPRPAPDRTGVPARPDRRSCHPRPTGQAFLPLPARPDRRSCPTGQAFLPDRTGVPAAPGPTGQAFLPLPARPDRRSCRSPLNRTGVPAATMHLGSVGQSRAGRPKAEGPARSGRPFRVAVTPVRCGCNACPVRL